MGSIMTGHTRQGFAVMYGTQYLNWDSCTYDSSPDGCTIFDTRQAAVEVCAALHNDNRGLYEVVTIERRTTVDASEHFHWLR